MKLKSILKATGALTLALVVLLQSTPALAAQQYGYLFQQYDGSAYQPLEVDPPANIFAPAMYVASWGTNQAKMLNMAGDFGFSPDGSTVYVNVPLANATSSGKMTSPDWIKLQGLGNQNPSSPTISLQTSTGAVGTQLSTTTGTWVSIAGQVSTTASIAGNASGDIIVEVAPTNSATAGDWVEWGRIGNSQALSLAITLQSVQIVKGQILAYVPAGYYIKARTAGSGTVSYQLNTVKTVNY